MGSVVPEHSSPESQWSFGAENSPFPWSGVSLTLKSRSCTISCFGKPGSSAENRRKSGGLVSKPQVFNRPGFCITQVFAVRVSRVALVLAQSRTVPPADQSLAGLQSCLKREREFVCQLKRGTRLKFCPERKNCFRTRILRYKGQQACTAAQSTWKPTGSP